MRKLIAGLCIFSVVTVCLAQKPKTSAQRSIPDLNGTWVLDPSKSIVTANPAENVTDYMLVIGHQEPEIRITNRFKKNGIESVREWRYYTDGRDENRGSRNIHVTTKWHDKTLYRRLDTNSGKPFSRLPEGTSTQEEWTVSEDGRTLTRTISRSSLGRPGRKGNEPLNEKYVFTRF